MQADGLPSEIIMKVSLVGPPEALCCALSLIEVRITPTFAAYVAVWRYYTTCWDRLAQLSWLLVPRMQPGQD